MVEVMIPFPTASFWGSSEEVMMRKMPVRIRRRAAAPDMGVRRLYESIRNWPETISVEMQPRAVLIMC